MRWLDGITNSMDVNLSNLQKAWCPARGRKELDTKTNKTPGANVGILGHESNSCPPSVHGPLGLYLQLPPGGSRGREGAQGHRKGLRFEKTQGVRAGAGGTGLGGGRGHQSGSRAVEAERGGEPLLGDSEGRQSLAVGGGFSKKRSEASKSQDPHPEQTETYFSFLVAGPAWHPGSLHTP